MSLGQSFWVSFLSHPVCGTLTWYLGCFSIGSLGFTGGSDSKESACNVGDLGSSPESGRSPEEGNGHLLHYSSLENPMNRGARWATVHGVTKSWTWLSDQLCLHQEATRLSKLIHPLTEKWIRKIWCIYTIEFYSAMEKNKVLFHTVTSRKLENMLGKRSQSHKRSHDWMIPFT